MSRKAVISFKFDYSDADKLAFRPPGIDSPILFHLRSKGPGADLVTSQYGINQKLPVEAPLDGTPVEVDLLARKSDRTGQLVIEQVKPPSLQARQAEEWSYTDEREEA